MATSEEKIKRAFKKKNWNEIKTYDPLRLIDVRCDKASTNRHRVSRGFGSPWEAPEMLIRLPVYVKDFHAQPFPMILTE